MYPRLAARLLVNGLYFRYLKYTGRAGKPAAVSLEITHDCIARCLMCNIWKIPPQVANLSVAQWRQILASPIFSNLIELDITGGEPYLVKALPDLFAGISALKPTSLRSLRSIAITTNGLLTRRVLAYTETILRILKTDRINLVVACAVDAVGPLHDRVRRVKDAWSKVHATIEGLLQLRSNFPHLILGLKTTILPITVHGLDAIADYAAERGLFTIMSPCIITQGRYLNAELTPDLVFNEQQTREVRRFYQRGRPLWRYHNEQMIRFYKTGSLKKACTCGFNYFFIRSDGTLLLCPLIDRPMGKVTESNLALLLSSGKARRLRRLLGRMPDCRRCTEPGLERFSLPYEGWTYLRLLAKMGPKSFLRMHRHMGLDNYFNHLGAPLSPLDKQVS
jgi:MoaA/NifB/PqqE/SkfB family radical SAM enzyme